MEQTQDCNQGTKGYMAPEWFKNLAITVKADVYSFGILLLEIICCRKKFDEEAEDENKMILADWHMIAINRRKCIFRCRMMVSHSATEDIQEMEKYGMIAILCIKEDPLLRPTMKKVTLMLEGTVEVSVPPDPSSFINSGSSSL
ncbi:hypothetical protein L3X38_030328 [Prunus dulcis]|uniref:Protein kinase domain-containing protein n=1 Tax=Prunus dulcis TaxID=3755 RepID=A0AAD4VC75_PRUDU|nr:hypothetical protein L3X38_030328 [Prunus dulcis]